MILPIVAYGDPILKKDCEEIDENYPDLKQLISDMFETMYKAKGVGLAAPQIGKNIRLFINSKIPLIVLLERSLKLSFWKNRVKFLSKVL